ncbi:ABC-F type ribosomal protection protein [Paenibacillus sp. sptzw28]|uniref:ribosomal protection-like ABC-F family protein n=1 Tax=Paenibacillus sp. sptzw28 TaxID=715179 RepID=UPI001C6E6F2B|nr:ABC-F type ribosomal protection protein [Paenibacillus sp. sptzw28]QYR23333.1 ABC-F type ribosomal protection protein [Paenibacillus sp. sptzw28]
MQLMTIEGIEKYIADRLLFRQEGRILIEGAARIGVVGRNGAGKSTLLAILAGRMEADGGRIIRSCTAAELLQAAGSRGGKQAARETAMPGAAPEREAEAAKRWAAPEEEAAEAHGSGGERTRLALAALMATGAELLIADEPTSHLDAEGTKQLEDTIAAYDGAVVLVSHDRALLDAVCTQIIELEDGKLTLFDGNYSDYRREKQARIARARFEYEQYAKDRARLETAIAEVMDSARGVRKKPRRMSYKEANLGICKRDGAEMSLHRKVKSLESRLSRLEVKEKPRDEEAPLFDASAHESCRSKHVLRIEELTAEFGDRVLFRRLNLHVRPGMRIALLGRNGAGKTTMLQMIAGQVKGVTFSPSCRMGYFRQNLTLLDESKTVLQNIMATTNYNETHVRTVLARTLFKREDALKHVSELSGGERVKATLAKLLLGGYNTLLLDEPTNYLDLFARESLEEALGQYPGTILFASHDKTFVRKVATHKLYLRDGEWELNAHGDEPDSAQAGPGGAAASAKASQEADEEIRLELLRLEWAITETLGRLSVLRPGEDPAELDAEFKRLVARKRELLTLG